MADLNNLPAQTENTSQAYHELMHVLAPKRHQSHFLDHLPAIVDPGALGAHD